MVYNEINDYWIENSSFIKEDSDTNPFRYCGEYYDAETESIYLRARNYDPGTGRFTSEDPARDGLNWYAYCDNNPVAFVDPSGKITQKEMDMFENGEMSPMAYSHLMNLTYQWILADTQESKDTYHKFAEQFRLNNYKTTNGEFKYVDDGIKFMESRPDDWAGIIPLSMREHFFRNKLNLNFTWEQFEKLSERLPNNMKWEKVIASFHQNHIVNGRENVKYVSPDGHFELVYNDNHELLTEYNNPDDMGTYNYYSPIKNEVKHTYYDVLPYLDYGNVLK